MEQREYTQEEIIKMVADMPENMILTVELGVEENDTV